MPFSPWALLPNHVAPLHVWILTICTGLTHLSNEYPVRMWLPFLLCLHLWRLPSLLTPPAASSPCWNATFSILDHPYVLLSSPCLVWSPSWVPASPCLIFDPLCLTTIHPLGVAIFLSIQGLSQLLSWQLSHPIPSSVDSYITLSHLMTFRVQFSGREEEQGQFHFFFEYRFLGDVELFSLLI